MVTKYYGSYCGVVADNKDPETRGRLLLRVPAVYGNNPYMSWVHGAGMYVGKGVIAAIPSVGDRVLVSFISGDARFPVWVPKSADADLSSLYEGGEPKRQQWKTPGGNILSFSDVDGEEQVSIESSRGAKVVAGEKVNVSNNETDLLTLHNKTLELVQMMIDALDSFAGSTLAPDVAGAGSASLTTQLTTALALLKTQLGAIMVSQVESTASDLLE